MSENTKAEILQARKYVDEAETMLSQQKRKAAQYTQKISALNLDQGRLLGPGLSALSELADDIVQQSNDQNGMTKKLKTAQELFATSLKTVEGSDNNSGILLEQLSEDDSALLRAEQQFAQQTKVLAQNHTDLNSQQAEAERQRNKSQSDYDSEKSSYDGYVREYNAKQEKIDSVREHMKWAIPVSLGFGLAPLLATIAGLKIALAVIEKDRDASFDKMTAAHKTLKGNQKILDNINQVVDDYVEVSHKLNAAEKAIKQANIQIKKQHEQCSHMQDAIKQTRQSLFQIHKETAEVNNAARIVTLWSRAASKVLKVLTKIPVQKVLWKETKAIFDKFDSLPAENEVRKQIEETLEDVRKVLAAGHAVARPASRIFRPPTRIFTPGSRIYRL
ncbi:Protein of unknown function [Pyronema omphalodes CBS 100304]|uniref:Uncharacterized protein n=1 Tax=Pyronema omphalodes (strain CBS 100304) TaxID=1076935 RepID=U4LC27_PYROM|nr:Protein of unknown function [Pyronema omphalodes CBS 100304]